MIRKPSEKKPSELFGGLFVWTRTGPFFSRRFHFLVLPAFRLVREVAFPNLRGPKTKASGLQNPDATEIGKVGSQRFTASLSHFLPFFPPRPLRSPQLNLILNLPANQSILVIALFLIRQTDRTAPKNLGSRPPQSPPDIGVARALRASVLVCRRASTRRSPLGGYSE